jgi:16S rRNA (adenine1518-N6/adenine1519-N6)-dimethyltransferase
MTESLLENGNVSRVVAFEIDRKLAAYLVDVLPEARLRVVQGDVIETWAEQAAASGPPARMLGNLPYASASAIIAMLMSERTLPQRSVVTVQRELAERMTAAPGEGAYSSFTVLCGAWLRMGRRGELSPGSFYPPPRVFSTVLELEPAPNRVHGSAADLLPTLTRELFRARRKTIRNNVAAGRWPPGMNAELVAEALRETGFDLGRRAEDYPPSSYAALTSRLAARR